LAENTKTIDLDLGASGTSYREKYGFYDPEKYAFKSRQGLDREIVEEISWMKNEPDWMRQFRLRSLGIFFKKPLPQWGGNLNDIRFDDIYYYVKATDKAERSWDEVPDDIRRTFDRLGIPEAERKFLAGAGAQYESESVYHHIKESIAKQGVIFVDTDTAVREYPDLVRQYFGTIVPPADNKFAALNSAVWSGGCLTADARVFTTNRGVKSIAEVREGDTVFALSQEGTLVSATVTAHVHSGQKPVYRFRVAGRTLEATGNHLFLALEKSATSLDRFGRKWFTVWKPLEELQVGDIIAIAKRIPSVGQSKPLPTQSLYLKNRHLQRSLRSPEKTSPDLMWLLGSWMGDGNTYAPHPHMRFINFALPESDPVRAEALRLVKELFNYTVKTQTPTSFTIHSKAIGEWLKEIGFVGKAKTKRVPDWVFGLPLKERLAFLGGLLDSDGWVENEGKTVCFELANRQLIEDIKLLSISCGLFSDGKIRGRRRHSAFLEQEKRQIISGDTYACRITGNVGTIGSRNPRLRALLNRAEKHTFDKYTTVTGENFSALATEDIGFAPIREKEHIGVRDVYDIQVDGFANFVANGIIAHNSFIYVPPGVHVDMPLQAYFRINAQNMGQFERTLIIVDEGGYAHYVEGCTAPIYSSDSLHSAVVEIIIKKGARARYTTIQNWSTNVYNLVTKRSVAYEDATMEWVDANLGSKLTMKYPSIYMLGKGAKGEVLSVAFAGKGQHQDAGGKVIHAAPYTSSVITSKSISKDGGRTTYRGHVKVYPGAVGSKSSVRCDALLLDEFSRSDTYPYNEIEEDDVTFGHEASVSKIGEEQLFYLMSRGLPEAEAATMVVSGFIEPIVKELPMEYSVEMNRLIQLQMEGSVG